MKFPPPYSLQSHTALSTACSLPCLRSQVKFNVNYSMQLNRLFDSDQWVRMTSPGGRAGWQAGKARAMIRHCIKGFSGL